jgi:CRP-like cAMP-binding protein
MMVAGARETGAPVEEADFDGLFRTESFPDGAEIIRASDTAERAYLIKSGRVRLLRARPDGSRSVTAILCAGDMFCDLFRPPEQLAVAAGPAEVWCLEPRDFQAQLHARPGMATHLMRAYSERARALRQRVWGLTCKDVPARLAEMLLTMADSHGDHCPHGGEADIRGITQQDFADLVGASRSFVSTLINEMKRDGLIGNVGRVLCIRDRLALQRVAETSRSPDA